LTLWAFFSNLKGAYHLFLKHMGLKYPGKKITVGGKTVTKSTGFPKKSTVQRTLKGTAAGKGFLRSTFPKG